MSLRVYLARHAEAEIGERLDPTRGLTPLGKAQSRMMGRWLKRQTVRPEVVIESNMRRSHQTARRFADRLGVDLIRASDGALDPDSTVEAAWDEILRIGEQMGAECVVAVGHGPLVQGMIAAATGGDEEKILFAHAAIAHLDADTMEMHWLVTPNTVARDEDELDVVTPPDLTTTEAAIVQELDAVTGILAEAGDYTYEDITLKRWVLGDGGRSGNCEDCVENADEGEIEESEFFPAGDDPVDEPPLHPNCDCTVTYRDTVRRVYA